MSRRYSDDCADGGAVAPAGVVFSLFSCVVSRKSRKPKLTVATKSFSASPLDSMCQTGLAELAEYNTR